MIKNIVLTGVLNSIIFCFLGCQEFQIENNSGGRQKCEPLHQLVSNQYEPLAGFEKKQWKFVQNSFKEHIAYGTWKIDVVEKILKYLCVPLMPLLILKILASVNPALIPRFYQKFKLYTHIETVDNNTTYSSHVMSPQKLHSIEALIASGGTLCLATVLYFCIHQIFSVMLHVENRALLKKIVFMWRKNMHLVPVSLHPFIKQFHQNDAFDNLSNEESKKIIARLLAIMTIAVA